MSFYPPFVDKNEGSAGVDKQEGGRSADVDFFKTSLLRRLQAQTLPH